MENKISMASDKAFKLTWNLYPAGCREGKKKKKKKKKERKKEEEEEEEEEDEEEEEERKKERKKEEEDQQQQEEEEEARAMWPKPQSKRPPWVKPTTPQSQHNTIVLR